MGNIYKAICDCGFTKEVTEGRGKLSAKIYIPIYCSNCQDIHSILDTETNCQKCGNHEAFRYFENPINTLKVKSSKWWLKRNVRMSGVNQDLVGTLEKKDGKYFCPKCQRHSLDFIIKSFWD